MAVDRLEFARAARALSAAEAGFWAALLTAGALLIPRLAVPCRRVASLLLLQLAWRKRQL